jgi:hypothetical protein
MDHFIFEGHLDERDTSTLATYVVTKFVFEEEGCADEIGFTFQYDKVESITVVKNPYPEIAKCFDPLIPYNIMAIIFKLEEYSEPKSYKVLRLNTEDEYRQKMLPIYERDYKRKKSY